MNVIRKDFFSKQKSFRRKKFSTFPEFAYHTVSNALPFDLSALENADFSSNLSASFNASCSRSGLSSRSSTLEDGVLQHSHRCFEEPADGEEALEGGEEISTDRINAVDDSEGEVVPSIFSEMGILSSRKEISGTDTEDTSQNIGCGKFSMKDMSQYLSNLATPVMRKPLRRNQPTCNKTPSHSTSFRSQNRSSTSKSSKSPITYDNDTGSFILAVTEGRGHARGEVGIAAVDPCRPHLILCQISDNQRHVHSLTKMNVFNFIEIIVPNTFIEGTSLSKLYIDIREHFPTVTITSVQRRHFNETVGLELINQYGSPESSSVMVLLKDKFYALSAASALIKYVEYTQNVLLAPRSVKVEYQGTEDTMLIDLNTANKLELVVSRARSESVSRITLYGTLNHCRTKGGSRLLRANILQPLCSRYKIESRLDCVTELVKNPLVLYALESAVSSFTNVENLLSLCMHEPQQDGLRAAEFQLKYVLLLKTILEQLPNLMTALENTTSEYFRAVRENLEDVRYKIILNRILEAVSENAKYGKGSMSAHLHACFAIKTGVNSLLDVAKKIYCEIVQEIWDHISHMREKYGLSLKMSFSAQRGFHIQYTRTPGENWFKPNAIPKHFTLIQKVRSTYYFYTSELVALDRRSQQVLNEVKLITNVIMFELLNDIREHIGCLFNLCEHIAELDVIISFAHVSSGDNYARPNFGTSLNVTNSRHPILDVIHGGKIVSNDIFAESNRNCVILTGPNQSGKSIYIGQVALLQIMAQIGCYVPATSAIFRITDRLFSRLGCDDSIETSASTLIAEMHDVEYLRQSLTANSLVIIDELCKGTSVDEGTNLAFTICEEFLDSSAFIFVTTHYMFLTKLEELYFNVVNYSFESELVESNGRLTLQLSHKMVPGVTGAEQYGLQVAERTCFPKDILATAKNIAQNLLLERKPSPEVHGLSARYKIALELKNELHSFEPDFSFSRIGPTVFRFKAMLLDHSPLDDYIIPEILHGIEQHPTCWNDCQDSGVVNIKNIESKKLDKISSFSNGGSNCTRKAVDGAKHENKRISYKSDRNHYSKLALKKKNVSIISFGNRRGKWKNCAALKIKKKYCKFLIQRSCRKIFRKRFQTNVTKEMFLQKNHVSKKNNFNLLN